MIAVIDYDAGNIKSVEKAFQFLGEEIVVSRDRDEILSADRVVLPGVGSFGDAMKKIKDYNLANTIYDVVDKKVPFLGICLGLQLLFESSDETKNVTGLGILPGKILRIPEKKGFKIPHIGWNSLKLTNNGRLYDGIDEASYVYFVHSYYLKAEEDEMVKASTEYVTHIHASVEKDNIFACQFHPEKSGDVGLKILDNFRKII